MNKISYFSKFLIAIGLTFIAVQVNASAQILPLNTAGPTISNSVNPTDGYYIFRPDYGSTDANELPDFVTIAITAPNAGYEFSTPPLTVGTTTYSAVGIAYGNTGTTDVDPTTGQPALNFATFTFLADAPSALKVGLLSDYPDLTYYTLNLYNSGGTLLYSSLQNPNQTPNTDGPPGYNSNNEFFYANVSGITSGDYLVVEGQGPGFASGAQVTLGGVTFDAVPEPATYVLMLGGLGMLLLVQRLRRRQV